MASTNKRGGRYALLIPGQSRFMPAVTGAFTNNQTVPGFEDQGGRFAIFRKSKAREQKESRKYH
ncbi:hypothetical protein GCM10009113_22780 [Marinobacter szutsaonensis]